MTYEEIGREVKKHYPKEYEEFSDYEAGRRYAKEYDMKVDDAPIIEKPIAVAVIPKSVTLPSEITGLPELPSGAEHTSTGLIQQVLDRPYGQDFISSWFGEGEAERNMKIAKFRSEEAEYLYRIQHTKHEAEKMDLLSTFNLWKAKVNAYLEKCGLDTQIVLVSINHDRVLRAAEREKEAERYGMSLVQYEDYRAKWAEIDQAFIDHKRREELKIDLELRAAEGENKILDDIEWKEERLRKEREKDLDELYEKRVKILADTDMHPQLKEERLARTNKNIARLEKLLDEREGSGKKPRKIVVKRKNSGGGGTQTNSGERSQTPVGSDTDKLPLTNSGRLQ